MREDDIQITVTTNRFGKRATRYLLQIVQLVLFKSCIKTVSVVEGRSSYFMCRLEAGHIMSICSGKNRPTEIMYRKLNAPAPPPSPHLINDQSIRSDHYVSSTKQGTSAKPMTCFQRQSILCNAPIHICL